MPKVVDVANLSGRHNSFTPLRLLFSFLVVIQHASITSAYYFNFSIGIFDCGSLAVFGFFAISGFLITPGILRGGFKKYLLRRSARIFPAFWCLNLVTALIFANIWQMWTREKNYVSISNTASFLIHNVIFLPASAHSPRAGWNLLQGLPLDVPRSGIVNSSIWTLPLEFTFYIALGILILLLNKFLSRKVKQTYTLLVLVLWLMSVYISTEVINFWNSNPTPPITFVSKWPYMLSFFVGSLMSYSSPKLMKLKHNLLIVPLLGIAYLSAFQTITWALFGSMAYAAATILFGSSNILVKFSSKTDISYGVYLYHYPVLQTLLHFLDRRNDRPLLIILTIFISAFLGYFSAKLVEEPALRWVKRKQSSR
jgi:peptidoglycan/LPS O-acetylase OafA/YrhL